MELNGASTNPKEAVHSPQVLDYRPKSADPSDWTRFVGAPTAGILLFVFAAAGILLNRRSFAAGSVLAIPVMGCALWYVFARFDLRRAAGTLTVIKLIAALSATALSPALLCGDVSPFSAARAYGWTNELAFGGSKEIALAIAIGVFAVVTMIEFIVSRHSSNEAQS